MDEHKEATIEKTASAIQDALDALDVLADIWIEGEDTREPYLSVSVDGVEAYELSEDLVTLQDVSAEMQAIAKSYDPQDRSLLHDMEEPYSAEELLFTKKVYDRIADASRAALEIQQGKEPEKVYVAYLERWNQEDRNACRKECENFLRRMNVLYNRPYGETMDILKDSCRKLNQEKEQGKQETFPVPGKENRAITVWVEDTGEGKPHWYDFTEAEALRVDFDKAFPKGYVDYYIDIDKDGIIQSDTLSPNTKGTRFTESYPGFRCKDNLYKESGKAISIEGMKEEMLVGLRKMVETYQEKYGISEKDIGKALDCVRKGLLTRSQERQHSR
ncbi:hypothetical protein ACTNCI_05895 [Mitsuokella jalaludinii]|uniref:hypothetical protein n=1 Tax=Mitsuokella jalaludinii TaxID=187979 RepID=UPI003F8BDFE1